MERGREEARHPGEEVGEEPLGVAQERAAGLDAPELLQQGEGQNLRVRELLEGLVAAPSRVEQALGVVDEAEQHGQRLFQGAEPRGILRSGHAELLWSGSTRMAPFLLANHATVI